ncbi:hypothetical protein Bca4012_009339 [Brassica carinata]
MHLKNDSTIDVGVLLGIAFGRHVRELELELYSPNEPYMFPTSLFNCGTGTLQTLKFGPNVFVDVPLENLEVKMYPHSDVEIEVETFTIDVPSLQSLTLISDDEDFIDSSVYVINAPHLTYLSLQGFTEDDSCLVENTTELVEAHITDVSSVIYENILGSLTSVKRLSLKIASPLKLSKFPTGRIFNQLVNLELHAYDHEWWYLFILMLDSSPNLQVLKLIGVSIITRKRDRPPYKRWSQPRYVPECLVNRLETLVWKNYKGEIEDERQVAQYILRNASRLKTATFSKTDIHPKQRLERFKELSSVVWASKSCQLVFK